MEKLSNGKYVLAGDYVKDGKIKQCSECNCVSPMQAKTCCWCGSKNLKVITDVEEVAKEQSRLNAAKDKDSKKFMIGIILIFIGIFFILSYLGVILIMAGCFFIAIAKSNKDAGYAHLNIKYNNGADFLYDISQKFQKQMYFLEDGEYYYEMKQNLNNTYNTQISKEALRKLLDLWCKAYLSPRVIQTRLEKYFKDNKIKYNKNKISVITESFYDANKKQNERTRQSLIDTYKTESEQMSTIQTPGLNYGIVTSSIGNAMLYNALNEREKKNQYNRQLSPILRNTNRNLERAVSDSYYSMQDSYDSYKTQIKAYVKKELSDDSVED